LDALAVHAESTSGGDNLTEFFSILATGEASFVTLYDQAVIHHERLGFHGAALNALEAIRAEEEIHLQFAQANGGVSAIGWWVASSRGRNPGIIGALGQ